MNLEHIKTLQSNGAHKIISGASALVFHEGKYYIIQDNSNSIYLLDDKFNLINERIIFEGSLPTEPDQRKKLKPDLEAAVIIPSTLKTKDQLLLIPSGSKSNRVNGALVNISYFHDKMDDLVIPVDFTHLFDFLKSKVGKVNIEGAVLSNDHLIFFQRGNSKESKNAIIYLKKDFINKHKGKVVFTKDHFIKVIYPELGAINGVAYTFTDAIILNDKIVYLASAEKTDDAYFDGAISGASVGLLSFNGKILWKRDIDTTNKFEGISFLSYDNQNQSIVNLMIISDADNDNIASAIYKLKIDFSQAIENIIE